MMVHRPLRASRLSEESDLVSVSPEVLDVVLDPVEGQGLVPQPQVARHLLCCRGEEAERSESVVDCHHHHAPVHEILRSVVPVSS